MANIAVTCADVSKRYGRRVALDALSLDIPSGGIVGILGPNGSGKSTLFRTLMGLTIPDTGHVSVMGLVPGWRTNATIAYFPDRARWYPDDTAQGALDWGAAVLPQFDLNRAVELAHIMNLDLSQRVREMSRGTEVRLMLILCLARQVPLMILDEPFAGIDMLSRDQIIEALVAYTAEQDTTVLISTHEIMDVESLFDYTVFLKAGRVIRQGEADRLRREYGSMRDIMRNLYLGEVHHP